MFLPFLCTVSSSLILLCSFLDLYICFVYSCGGEIKISSELLLMHVAYACRCQVQNMSVSSFVDSRYLVLAVCLVLVHQVSAASLDAEDVSLHT